MSNGLKFMLSILLFAGCNDVRLEPADPPPRVVYRVLAGESMPVCENDDVAQRAHELVGDGTETYRCVWPCSLWTSPDGSIGPRRVKALFIRWQGEGDWSIQQPGYESNCEGSPP